MLEWKQSADYTKDVMMESLKNLSRTEQIIAGCTAALGIITICSVCCIGASILSSSQDRTEVAERAAPVLEPTTILPAADVPEPTATPLPTATPEPSPTATQVVAPTATREPSPTATQVVADTATPQPTEDAVPPPIEPPPSNEPQVVIVSLNKRDEYVDIQNTGSVPVDLAGWNLVSEKGNRDHSQECSLSGVIQPGDVLRIWALAKDSVSGGFNCGYGSNIWNNEERDPAVLYNASGVEVSRIE